LHRLCNGTPRIPVHLVQPRRSVQCIRGFYLDFR
jgi:hypothetical protein